MASVPCAVSHANCACAAAAAAESPFWNRGGRKSHPLQQCPRRRRRPSGNKLRHKTWNTMLPLHLLVVGRLWHQAANRLSKCRAISRRGAGFNNGLFGNVENCNDIIFNDIFQYSNYFPNTMQWHASKYNFLLSLHYPKSTWSLSPFRFYPMMTIIRDCQSDHAHVLISAAKPRL